MSTTAKLSTHQLGEGAVATKRWGGCKSSFTPTKGGWGVRKFSHAEWGEGGEGGGVIVGLYDNKTDLNR